MIWKCLTRASMDTSRIVVARVAPRVTGLLRVHPVFPPARIPMAGAAGGVDVDTGGLQRARRWPLELALP
ncbi:MAG: hypothetical protein GXO15_06385 [Crenarchaeota archaeon]|nr:hypothetical protein [Thermoproteota archaeon]